MARLTPKIAGSARLPRLTASGIVAVLLLATGCDGSSDDAPEPAPTASASSQAGPGGPAGPGGTVERRVTVGGAERSFRLHQPAGLARSTAVPLVVMLHGALGTAAQAEEAYGWNAAAAREGFLVAYPDGTRRTWAVSDGCCGPAVRAGVDDVAFVEEVVRSVAAERPVDPNRVYVTGISNGGMLAYRLGCESTTFAAIGPVAATRLGDCPSPAPISLIHIHGSADRTVPYGGGPGKRDNGGTGDRPVKMDGPAVPELVAQWRRTGGCAEPTVGSSGPVTTSESTCPGGRAVRLVTVDGAGHQWPGAAHRPSRGPGLLDLDPPSSALSATETLWSFFAAHPKPPPPAR
ncbi:alpha/beta hydrolase family esterase [Plantactinospora sp. WMMB782]|uniref:extracellular catalytic domain type 1 short-chain-length polyhydroxyalkanoate depolymerase n=1 Tax=Plantactinospora sp. WMMB782 TaxID=3404121 RepID=UPI003B922967